MFFKSDTFLVLFSKSARGLTLLIEIVKRNCDKLKMLVSIKKSHVISPDERVVWTVIEEDGSTSLSLKKVLEYKYLGIQTFQTYFKTVQNWQKRSVALANKYKWACQALSRTGPDTVLLGLMAWTAVAGPSIRFGCESIPFADCHIDSIERYQSQLFKTLLHLGSSCPNICTQTEFGVKFFRHQLYIQQLTFYTRLLKMDKTRWPFMALMEHLKKPTKSPYFKYIYRIRSELGLLEAPLTSDFLQSTADSHFLSVVNAKLSQHKLPAMTELSGLSSQPYLCESVGAQYYAKYRLNHVDLGRHVRREGHRTQQEHCPLCINTVPQLNTPFHIVMQCPYLKDIRKVTGISTFMNLSLLQGLSPESAYNRFLTARDLENKTVGREVCVQRGNSLKAVTDIYLSLW